MGNKTVGFYEIKKNGVVVAKSNNTIETIFKRNLATSVAFGVGGDIVKEKLSQEYLGSSIVDYRPASPTRPPLPYNPPVHVTSIALENSNPESSICLIPTTFGVAVNPSGVRFLGSGRIPSGNPDIKISKFYLLSESNTEFVPDDYDLQDEFIATINVSPAIDITDADFLEVYWEVYFDDDEDGVAGIAREILKRNFVNQGSARPNLINKFTGYENEDNSNPSTPQYGKSGLLYSTVSQSEIGGTTMPTVYISNNEGIIHARGTLLNDTDDDLELDFIYFKYQIGTSNSTSLVNPTPVDVTIPPNGTYIFNLKIKL